MISRLWKIPYALSKRVNTIEGFVQEKVTDIKVNLNRSLEQLEERNKVISSDHRKQRIRWTYLNDLVQC